ncbi:MAG: substrate-binding domain-containing protein [Clostridiales bacterium]|jgi:phosphate transport system substrate-binding protein|nr:substrate-binding domain-containing protein [Clostridiales bacterium]
MRLSLVTAIFIGLPIIGLFIKKPPIRKISASLLCFAGLLVACFFLEFIQGIPLITNLFGTGMFWLAPFTCGILFLIFLLLIWKPFKAKPRKIAALSLTAVMVLTVGAVAGIQAYENSVLEIGDTDREIQLEGYEPFAEHTLAKSLAEPSTLTFADSLPRMDGATALYPLYAAFARAAYPEKSYRVSGEFDSEVVCSSTTGAFENLLEGNADVIFLMDVSEEQAQAAAERGIELALTPIGREAFVFIVNSHNNISGLSQDDIRRIYSGAVRDWSEISGGAARGGIEPYQRPEGSGSQTALQKIMGNLPIIEPKARQVFSFMGGMYNAIADYKNYKGAIGYSFRYYIETMLNDAELQKVKLLKIDDAAPTVENIASGAYPFAGNFYAVTAANRVPAAGSEKARAENTRALIDWILSEQGQSLVEQTGYVALSR